MKGILLDIEALEPRCARLFGRHGLLREWSGQGALYSKTVTLAGCYTDFFALGKAALRTLAEIHGIELAEGDVAALTHAMANMPAYPDVAQGLSRLCDDDYRLVAPRSDRETLAVLP